jgi:four helix bundle protein
MLRFGKAEMLKSENRAAFLQSFQLFSVSNFRFYYASQRFNFSAFIMSRLSDGLRTRCKAFASETIRLYIALPKGRDEVQVIGKQLLRSGTSVAAHSREASRARSDAEFCSKVEGLLQEADESQLWIELLADDCGIRLESMSRLHSEAGELLAIFTTMVAKLRRKTLKF